MAKQKKPALSKGFDSRRLDAIGKWKCQARGGNLELTWLEPPELAGLSFPLALMFVIAPGGSTFDPDDQMFALWELFQKRKLIFAKQLQEVTSGGEIDWAQVVVSRSAQGVPELSVRLTVKEDDEHNYLTYYEPGTQAFGPIVS